MAKGFKHGGGGGGSDLSVKVITYESVEALRADAAKDNTIGVVTDTKVTGWVFDYVEPSDMANGAVWFQMADDSAVSFNALKHNVLKVCVAGAMQKKGDVLDIVPAYLRRNGEWVFFVVTELYLFKDGNEYTEITGGWVRSGNNGTIENTGTSLKITVPGGYKSGGAKLVNMFDLTDYNAIECDWSGDNSLKLYVQKDGKDVASGKGSIDISAITGMCSLRIYTESSGSTIDVLEFTYLRLTK